MVLALLQLDEPTHTSLEVIVLKKFLLPILSILLTPPLFAGELTVYAYKHYKLKGKLYQQFEEKTGIKVKTVFGGAGEIMKRLVKEGSDSPADVLLMADVGRLYSAKTQGLLQEVKSQALTSKIPAKYRDPDNMWFGFAKRARVIYYNAQTSGPDAINTYEDLADPQWEGKIRVRSSANIYNQSFLAAMIAHKGLGATQKWVQAIERNLAQNPPKGDDRAQAIAVADHQSDIAIANHYYMGKMLHNKKVPSQQEAAKRLKMKFLTFQNGGTHINLSAAAVAQSSDNVAEAIQFLEFLLEDSSQELMAQVNYEYPVVGETKLTPLVQSWGNVKEDEISSYLLGKLNQEAAEIIQTSRWQ